MNQNIQLERLQVDTLINQVSNFGFDFFKTLSESPCAMSPSANSTVPSTASNRFLEGTTASTNSTPHHNQHLNVNTSLNNQAQSTPSSTTNGSSTTTTTTTTTSNNNNTSNGNDQEDQEDLFTSSMIPPPMNVIKSEQSEQVWIAFYLYFDDPTSNLGQRFTSHFFHELL